MTVCSVVEAGRQKDAKGDEKLICTDQRTTDVTWRSFCLILLDVSDQSPYDLRRTLCATKEQSGQEASWATHQRHQKTEGSNAKTGHPTTHHHLRID